MARWKAHGGLSIHVGLFFAIYYGSGVMRQYVYRSAVFTEGRPLCTQILHGQGCLPSTILGTRKLRYLMVKTVPSFWHNTRVWWTERHDRFAVAYTALAKLALWHTVKWSTMLTKPWRGKSGRMCTCYNCSVN